MNARSLFRPVPLAIVILLGAALAGSAQEIRTAERARDGYFEVTLKSPGSPKLNADEFVRDRNLNPGALYRVRAGGYLSFDESDWVDKIEFKPFDTPVTDLPEYRRFADLLTEVNTRIWEITNVLGAYDQLALRVLNLGDKHKFDSFEGMDDNIAQQLAIYDKMANLRELVTHSLNRFVRDRTREDKYADYVKTLDIYTRRLGELSDNYERLARRSKSLTQQIRLEEEKSRERK